MAERTKTWCKELKWTETCFSSCYCSCNLFQARLTEKKFRPASACTLFYVEVQMLRHHYPTIPGFFHCASVYVIVYQMWCCQCVSSQLAGHTHCWSAIWGHSVLIPLNTDMPEVLHDLHGLLRTWPVPLHRRPMWNTSFLPVGCSILDDEELSQMSRDECLHKTQTVLEETSCPL